MITRAAACFALTAFILAACSDDPSPADQGGKLGDGGTPDTSQGADSAVTARAALESVMTKLTLPNSGTDFARDIDGNGTPDNALGGLVGAIKAIQPLQPEVDAALADGSLLLLFEVFADSLSDAPSARVQANLGEDGDTDDTNNLTLDTPLKVDPASPSTLTLNGAVRAGKVGAAGDLVFPLPINDTMTLLTIKSAFLTATVNADGMTDGLVSGAIPWTDVEQKLVTGIAAELTKNDIDFFDANKDGTTTPQEVLGNFLVSLVLKPDLDMDKDGTADAMSIGFGFETVRCKILR